MSGSVGVLRKLMQSSIQNDELCGHRRPTQWVCSVNKLPILPVDLLCHLTPETAHQPFGASQGWGYNGISPSFTFRNAAFLFMSLDSVKCAAPLVFLLGVDSRKWLLSKKESHTFA